MKLIYLSYATDPVVRNDVHLLCFVTFREHRPVRLEALPLKLEYGHTRLASGGEGLWIRRKFKTVCTALGTVVTEEDDRLLFTCS
ncbi:MAG: hypothetical protein ACE5JI_06390 [Acidobacteriota bacterium]